MQYFGFDRPSFGFRTFGFGDSFSPLELFAGGKQGVWYDPSDKSTLFQDVAGTVPVTKDGDPVALMLDKSQGLVSVSELVSNGTFNSDLLGWTASSSVQLTRDTSVFESGGAKSTVSGTGTTYFSQSLGSNFIVGRSYKATALVYTPSTNSLDCRAAIGIVNSGLSTNTVFQKNTDIIETISIIFTATSTTHSLYCSIARTDGGKWGVVGDKAIFDSISVKELKGNHATQSVSAARPTYQTDGFLHWLKPDGADDVLYTGNLNLGEYDGVSSWIGIREEREADNTELLSFSESAFSTDYAYSLRKSLVAYKGVLRGTSAPLVIPYSSENAVEGSNAVVSLTVSTLQGSYSIARNNDPKIKASISVGTLAPLGNHPLYIAGRPAGFNTKSRIYGIVISGEKDEVTEAKVLQYLSKKSGVTL